MNGRELLARLRATPRWLEVPIILFTPARLNGQDEARASYGADDDVLKGDQRSLALVAQVIATFRSTRASRRSERWCGGAHPLASAPPSAGKVTAAGHTPS